MAGFARARSVNAVMFALLNKAWISGMDYHAPTR